MYKNFPLLLTNYTDNADRALILISLLIKFTIGFNWWARLRNEPISSTPTFSLGS